MYISRGVFSSLPEGPRASQVLCLQSVRTTKAYICILRLILPTYVYDNACLFTFTTLPYIPRSNWNSDAQVVQWTFDWCLLSSFQGRRAIRKFIGINTSLLRFTSIKVFVEHRSIYTQNKRTIDLSSMYTMGWYFLSLLYKMRSD